jgi:hypothetical protein
MIIVRSDNFREHTNVTRHSKLYLNACHLLAKRSRQSEIAILENEVQALQNCTFRPRTTNLPICRKSQLPCGTKSVIERLRNAHEQKQKLDQLLTPRQPMKQPRATTFKRPIKPQGIRVEVVGNGTDNGKQVTIGEFVIHPTKDPMAEAQRFGVDNKLSEKQIQRLQSKLHSSMNSLKS